MIYIGMNFRTGSLGFHAHRAFLEENGAVNTTGNYGQQDQRLGLQWVCTLTSSTGSTREHTTAAVNSHQL